MTEIQKTIDEWVGSDPDNVGRILTFLEDACCATASHARSNWQDENTAKAWEKIARQVTRTQHFFLANRPY